MPYRFNSYLIGIATLCASALAQGQEAKLLRDRTEAERPAIMFVGSPHLANHNRDVITTTVPDVLTPERQTEIAEVVAALTASSQPRSRLNWQAKNRPNCTSATPACYRAAIP
ncbi:hypothetical protein MJ904_26170 [Massilia sp. MB5]|uniref:hypothetical protein n=1 Tax=Massilia sp. MB5 TaxID=2919578 RepID=UPI001F0E8496|nr:hypothetical protein [Massilia sp. MB5]UMR30424.1 hypothetical protein MJ904_26170 [Massilia sp. MB5]